MRVVAESGSCDPMRAYACETIRSVTMTFYRVLVCNRLRDIPIGAVYPLSLYGRGALAPDFHAVGFWIEIRRNRTYREW